MIDHTRFQVEAQANGFWRVRDVVTGKVYAHNTMYGVCLVVVDDLNGIRSGFGECGKIAEAIRRDITKEGGTV